jgi:hypothetical protein
MESLQEKMARLAAERERLAEEENAIRAEAREELARVVAEMDKLESRKEELEAFLGLDDGGGRAEHGQIRDLCISVVSRNPDGISASRLRETLEQENPGLRLSSVPGTLSRLVNQGRLRRDELGRYLPF